MEPIIPQKRIQRDTKESPDPMKQPGVPLHMATIILAGGLGVTSYNAHYESAPRRKLAGVRYD
jgi:electron transfer flavoprotein alpha subunit